MPTKEELEQRMKQIKEEKELLLLKSKVDKEQEELNRLKEGKLTKLLKRLSPI